MEAERAEMKKIKKEKEDKHWAQHEAFQIMIHKARKEREDKQKQQDTDKVERKQTLKEMMAKAKADKEANQKPSETSEKLDGIYKHQDQPDRTFFDQVQQKAEQRYEEKQKGIEHEEPLPSIEEQEKLEKEQSQGLNELSKQFDQSDIDEKLKPMPKSIDDIGKKDNK